MRTRRTYTARPLFNVVTCVEHCPVHSSIPDVIKSTEVSKLWFVYHRHAINVCPMLITECRIASLTSSARVLRCSVWCNALTTDATLFWTRRKNLCQLLPAAATSSSCMQLIKQSPRCYTSTPKAGAPSTRSLDIIAPTLFGHVVRRSPWSCTAARRPSVSRSIAIWLTARRPLSTVERTIDRTACRRTEVVYVDWLIQTHSVDPHFSRLVSRDCVIEGYKAAETVTYSLDYVHRSVITIRTPPSNRVMGEFYSDADTLGCGCCVSLNWSV